MPNLEVGNAPRPRAFGLDGVARCRVELRLGPRLTVAEGCPPPFAPGGLRLWLHRNRVSRAYRDCRTVTDESPVPACRGRRRRRWTHKSTAVQRLAAGMASGATNTTVVINRAQYDGGTRRRASKPRNDGIGRQAGPAGCWRDGGGLERNESDTTEECRSCWRTRVFDIASTQRVETHGAADWRIASRRGDATQEPAAAIAFEF